jgi:predicted transcriptional regulator
MKYRSRTEIMDSILRSLGPGATKTQIMYKAYLSFSQLKEYLSILQEKNLLAYEEGSNLYRLTQKGLRFMNAYDEIEQLVSTPAENRNTVKVNEDNVLSLKKGEKYSF